MNSLSSSGHVVSAATTQFCPWSTRAAKDNTDNEWAGCFPENCIYTQPAATLGPWVGHSLQTPGLQGKGEAEEIQRVQRKPTQEGGIIIPIS